MNKLKHKKYNHKVSKIIFVITIILFPMIIFLFDVATHSNYFFNKDIVLFILIILSIILLTYIVINIKYIFYKINKKQVITIIAIIIYFSFYLIGDNMLYGSNPSFRNWLINNSMATLNHQYLAKIFYTDSIIQNSLSTADIYSITQIELLDFSDIDFSKTTYLNKYEKQILTKDEGNNIYKIIPIKGTTSKTNVPYSGYLAVIYDPSMVHIGVSKGAGISGNTYGQVLTTISKNYDALVAINAGGFYDPNWNSNGGIPHGIVYSYGKLESEYTRAVSSGGLVGFDKDNRLVMKRMTVAEAENEGIRDAVDFGPYLIVNGINQYKNRRGGWGIEPRTAIGQRKDGIVLMLVLDGRQSYSKGLDLDDLALIMENYGAYNAANMDGGTSTSLAVNSKIINNPHNGNKRTIRALPNAWIVSK